MKQDIPEGHPYSPYPSEDDLERGRLQWESPPASVQGIDLRVSEQVALLHELSEFEFFTKRYNAAHPRCVFPPCDAEVLQGMLRHLRPKRLIEVGSGFSTTVILDTNEQFLAWGTRCTLIEPFPVQMFEVVDRDDFPRVDHIRKLAQDCDSSVFDVGDGDILFIDSSHVTKVGSDVNYLVFEVLPGLDRGVYVHFHDIFWPFEYPSAWHRQTRVWTETYLLRAFLQNNRDYEVVLFNHYLARLHYDEFAKAVPSVRQHPTPGSIWLRRV